MALLYAFYVNPDNPLRSLDAVFILLQSRLIRLATIRWVILTIGRKTHFWVPRGQSLDLSDPEKKTIPEDDPIPRMVA